MTSDDKEDENLIANGPTVLDKSLISGGEDVAELTDEDVAELTDEDVAELTDEDGTGGMLTLHMYNWQL